MSNFMSHVTHGIHLVVADRPQRADMVAERRAAASLSHPSPSSSYPSLSHLTLLHFITPPFLYKLLDSTNPQPRKTPGSKFQSLQLLDMLIPVMDTAMNVVHRLLD